MWWKWWKWWKSRKKRFIKLVLNDQPAWLFNGLVGKSIEAALIKLKEFNIPPGPILAIKYNGENIEEENRAKKIISSNSQLEISFEEPSYK